MVKMYAKINTLNIEVVKYDYLSDIDSIWIFKDANRS